jgi:hypothetical protein
VPRGNGTQQKKTPNPKGKEVRGKKTKQKIQQYNTKLDEQKQKNCPPSLAKEKEL